MKNLVDEEKWGKTVFNVPSLVICSKNSGIPNDYESTLRKQYSNMEYYEFENTGHFIMMEDPKKLNEILWDFIKY